MNKKDTFFVTGGPVGRNSLSYVERQADADLYKALSDRTFCYVLTPRQMGKSSLVVRAGARLKGEGVAVANVDLTIIGQAISAEQWYRSILRIVGEQLKLEEEVLEFWRSSPEEGPLDRLMQALQKVVLTRLDAPVVIFIDEVDYVRSLPFSTGEFFAAIRALHNKRTMDQALERLTFCLLGVASLSDLIEGTQTTPYNIGHEIEVTDFNEHEAVPLIQGLGRPHETGAAILNRVLYWTGGHPYLTQRLCQEVADDPEVVQASDVDRISESLFLSNNARISDKNLVFVRDSILESKADRASLLDLYGRVHRQTSFISQLGDMFSSRMARAYWFVRGYTYVRDDETNPLVTVLRLSGITRVVGDQLAVRNRIYYSVFDRRWIASSMPDEEQRRQGAAFTRGAVRIGGIAALILLVVSGLAIMAYKGQRDAERERAKTAAALGDAKEQRNIAEAQTIEARRHKARAEEQARVADDLRVKAEEASKREAYARQIAEAGKAEAEKQRQIALGAKQKVDAALNEAQRRVKTVREYQDGVDQYFKKNQTKAIEHFNNALTLYDEQLNLMKNQSTKEIREDKLGQAITLTNIGAAYAQSGSSSSAKERYKRAQAIYQGLQDRSGEAYTRLKLGEVYLTTNTAAAKDEALSELREAKRIYKESGNMPGAAEALTVIAKAYLGPGAKYNVQTKFSDIKQTVDTYNEVLDIYRSVGNLAKEIETLSEILQWFDRVRAAKNEIPRDEYSYFLNARAEAFKRRGDLSLVPPALLNLITASNDAGNQIAALDALRKLLVEYGSDKDFLKNQASVYSTLIELSVKLNNEQRGEVISFLTQRLERFRANNNRSEEVGTLGALGQVYYRAGDKTKALHYYDETVKAASYADNTNLLAVADFFRLIGQHYYVSGDTQKALDIYGKAHTIYQQAKNVSGQMSSLQFLGELYYSEGTVADKYKAIESFTKVVELSIGKRPKTLRSIRPENTTLFHSARAVSDIYKELGEEKKRNQFLVELHDSFLKNNQQDSRESSGLGFGDPLIDFAVLSLFLGDKNGFVRYATEAFLKPGSLGFSRIGEALPPILLAGGKEEGLKIIDRLITDQDTKLEDLADPSAISFGMSFLTDEIRDRGLLNKLYARYQVSADKKELSHNDALGFSGVLNILGERKRAGEIYLSRPPENATVPSSPSSSAFEEEP